MATIANGPAAIVDLDMQIYFFFTWFVAGVFSYAYYATVDMSIRGASRSYRNRYYVGGYTAVDTPLPGSTYYWSYWLVRPWNIPAGVLWFFWLLTMLCQVFTNFFVTWYGTTTSIIWLVYYGFAISIPFVMMGWSLSLYFHSLVSAAVFAAISWAAAGVQVGMVYTYFFQWGNQSGYMIAALVTVGVAFLWFTVMFAYAIHVAVVNAGRKMITAERISELAVPDATLPADWAALQQSGLLEEISPLDITLLKQAAENGTLQQALSLWLQAARASMDLDLARLHAFERLTDDDSGAGAIGQANAIASNSAGMAEMEQMAGYRPGMAGRAYKMVV